MKPPWCDKCGRPCEELRSWYDQFMQRMTFVAICHGERERVDVSEQELNELPRLGLSMSVAFRQPGGNYLPCAENLKRLPQ